MLNNEVVKQQINLNVMHALIEDVGIEDITGLLMNETQEIAGYIMTREPMILCGTEWAMEVFRQVGLMELNSTEQKVNVQWNYQDADFIPANKILCRIQGNARLILCAERTVLNFLQTLSATATVTHHYVQCLSGLKTKLLDTRKTLPGLRYAQKYAVHCGGGVNHRMGLFDAFLIKENHITACGSITDAIKKARALYPNKKLEIEVETLNELHEALVVAPDVIMLDNFDLKKIKMAMDMRIEMNAEKIFFEVSGNVTLDNLRTIAEMGVDYISTGAITKNIKAIDLTLLLEV